MLRHLPNLITALRMLLVVPLCWLIDDGRYDGALLVAAVAGFQRCARRLARQALRLAELDRRHARSGRRQAAADGGVRLARARRRHAGLARGAGGRARSRDRRGAVAYHNLVGRFDAAPSRLSKLTTVVQIVFVLGELLRLSHWIDVPTRCARALIAVTAALTLASGLHYVVVWGARASRALHARGRPTHERRRTRTRPALAMADPVGIVGCVICTCSRRC